MSATFKRGQQLFAVVKSTGGPFVSVYTGKFAEAISSRVHFENGRWFDEHSVFADWRGAALECQRLMGGDDE